MRPRDGHDGAGLDTMLANAFAVLLFPLAFNRLGNSPTAPCRSACGSYKRSSRGDWCRKQRVDRWKRLSGTG
jgi:hypothetical protein